MAASIHQFEAAQFRERVRAFVQVMLVIDVLAYVSDVITPLVVPSLQAPPVPLDAQVVRWLSTLCLGSTWALMKYGRVSLLLAVLLETLATMWVVFVYVYVGHRYQPDGVTWFGTVFSLFGVLLLLTLRAAIVPSSILRTLGVGAYALTIYLFVLGGELKLLEPRALEGLIFLGSAFVLAIGATSHVIYGLRAQVRDAVQLGQYTLEEKLGQGGMGEVYRAKHSRLRRATAVKLLPASLSSESAVARFESEVQMTASLTHPHTIRIYDYGRTDQGVFYYAMEYLEGADLEQIVRLDGPQPVGRVLKLLEAAASALEEAHESGLIHRDIKPANLMLSRQGLDPDGVKVLDFGLVRRLDAPREGGRTHADTLVGTPLYMAPETIREGSAASAVSDLYALAAVGYFLATGTPVFDGENIYETCSHHLHTAPESLSSRLGRPVPQDFEQLILQCLAKDPKERIATAGEFAQALRSCRDFGSWTLDDARAWWRKYEDGLLRVRAARSEAARSASRSPQTLKRLTVAAR